MINVGADFSFWEQPVRRISNTASSNIDFLINVTPFQNPDQRPSFLESIFTRIPRLSALSGIFNTFSISRIVRILSFTLK